MTLAHDLEIALYQKVSPSLRSLVPTLAQIFAAVAGQEQLPDSAAERLGQLDSIEDILAHLAGQQVATSRTLLNFGANSQLGDVTIRDVVGGNNYKITVDLSQRNMNQYVHGAHSAQVVAQYSTIYMHPGAERETPWSSATPSVSSLGSAAESSLAPCPYPGLEQYAAHDVGLFYGREGEISAILGQIRFHNLFLVTGPSGSGKSSLVFAGVTPRMKRDPHWHVISMRPDAQPTQRLKVVLGSTEVLPVQEDTLPLLVSQVLAQHKPARKLLLVIDQFEEVFTLASIEERMAFFEMLRLLYTVEVLRNVCCTVLVMRIDFIPRLMNAGIWLDIKNRPQHFVDPLRGEMLRKAIEEPARKVGVTIEPLLVERLLADSAVEHNPGVLPLLQETMVFLWSSIEAGRISLQAYREIQIGVHTGLAAAITLRAEAIYLQLSPSQQQIARRIFIRLIHFGEGRLNTRRQQSVTALYASNEDIHEFETVLDYLTKHRLLTRTIEDHGHRLQPEQGLSPDTEPKVDLAHEALIDGWPRLKRWLDEQRENEVFRRRLRSKTDEWIRLGRQEGGLLDLVLLNEAESWLTSIAADELGADDELGAFIAASRAQIERTSRKERLAQTLAEVAIAFSAAHSLTEIQILMLDKLAAIKLYSSAVVLLYEEGSGRFEVGEARGLDLTRFCVSSFSSDSDPLLHQLVREKRPVLIEDSATDERFALLRQAGWFVQTWVATPILVEHVCIGVLAIGADQTSVYSTEIAEWLLTVANYAGLSLRTASRPAQISNLAAALDRREIEYQAVLTSLSEGVIVFDLQQVVTLFNPAAEQVLDISADVLHGRPLEALVEYDTDDVTRRRIQTIYKVLAEGLRQMRQGQRSYNTTFNLTEPAQVIAVNMAPMQVSNGQRYGDVVVLRDMTREIEADQAKRQFISDVTHELRTPLTAIKGYVDVLLLSGTKALSEDQVSYLGIIKNNANRLRALIDDILEFSRPDSKGKLNFTQVDILVLINEVVQSIRLEYERKQMHVTIDVPDSLPPVTADQKRITQVIFNLFSNAVKYTYDSGRIQVRAFLNRANMMQIEVEDSGVGMSPDQRKKLFRPFYRADNPLRDVAGGTGLGLSIAKSFVEEHGGEMWVTSELGKGSIFCFILPLTQSKVESEDEAE